VGYPFAEDGKLFNALAVIKGRECLATYRKQCLPNYQVFDEHRYFDSGKYCSNWNRSGTTCRQSDNNACVAAPLDGSRCNHKNEHRHKISRDDFKICPDSNAS